MNRDLARRGLAALAIVAGLAVAWRWLATSEEDRVREAIAGLVETLSSRDSDPLGQVAAIGTLRARLAEDVVVETPGPPLRGRDAVAGLWQRLRAGSDAITVRLFDVAVVVADDGRRAETTGVAELTRTRGGVPERELHEVRATFVKVDGEWRLARAARDEPVTPPAGGESGSR